MASGERSARVLVVEDEASIRLIVRMCLQDEGYDVEEAEDAFSAAQHLGRADFDLVLLDLNLPDVGGQELLARIRRGSDVPVVVLSGRATEHDRVTALRAGADDYIVKPFSVPEFLARVDSVLRRSRAVASRPADGRLQYDDLIIDLGTRDVTMGGELVELTAREFDLLVFLASSPRQVFSRDQILEQVWGSSVEWQDSATVTEHVRRIRRKVEADPDHPRYLQTVRSVGYRFQP